MEIIRNRYKNQFVNKSPVFIIIMFVIFKGRILTRLAYELLRKKL